METIARNKGASVPDAEAIKDGQSIIDWRRQQGIVTSEQIRTVRLVHMRYQHPDLVAICLFLQDFGMQIAQETDEKIYFRGYGSDQYVYYARRDPKNSLAAPLKWKHTKTSSRHPDWPVRRQFSS